MFIAVDYLQRTFFVIILSELSSFFHCKCIYIYILLAIVHIEDMTTVAIGLLPTKYVIFCNKFYCYKYTLATISIHCKSEFAMNLNHCIFTEVTNSIRCKQTQATNCIRCKCTTPTKW